MIATDSSSVNQLSPGRALIDKLNSRVEQIVTDVCESDLWRVIGDSSTPTEVVRAMLAEIYWEIHCYHPATTPAGFKMIGRIDPDEMKAMRIMLLHKWDEVEHRVWALDGYLALGGDRDRVGNEDRWMSPGAFAIGAVWQRMGNELPAISYLGGEYLFEDLTARLSVMVIDLLADRELSSDGMRFIVDHAREDEKHSLLLRNLIIDLVDRKPELSDSILFCFDCFAHVYPLPLWTNAVKRVPGYVNQ